MCWENIPTASCSKFSYIDGLSGKNKQTIVGNKDAMNWNDKSLQTKNEITYCVNKPFNWSGITCNYIGLQMKQFLVSLSPSEFINLLPLVEIRMIQIITSTREGGKCEGSPRVGLQTETHFRFDLPLKVSKRTSSVSISQQIFLLPLYSLPSRTCSYLVN